VRTIDRGTLLLLASGCAQQQTRHADHAIERRADFVAHVGEEIGSWSGWRLPPHPSPRPVPAASPLGAQETARSGLPIASNMIEQAAIPTRPGFRRLKNSIAPVTSPPHLIGKAKPDAAWRDAVLPTAIGHPIIRHVSESHLAEPLSQTAPAIPRRAPAGGTGKSLPVQPRPPPPPASFDGSRAFVSSDRPPTPARRPSSWCGKRCGAFPSIARLQ